MNKTALFAALTITALFMALFPALFIARAWPQQSRREKNMNDEARIQLLQTVGNSKAEMSVRLTALENLVSSPGPTTAVDLVSLFNRARPGAENIKGWDPAGAERVVDLHIVAALHRLGRDSELGRIGVLVRQAGRVLLGPEDELRNAAGVILAIGRTEPVADLVALTSDPDQRAVRNAVRTLDQLKLPDVPVRQGTANVPGIDKRVTFTIRRLRQELEAIASQSAGVIVLSEQVKSPSLRDYDRGEVRRENVALSEIIEKDLPDLDFDYFVQNGRVVICTYAEAGARWRAWWQANASKLQYQRERSLFVLRSGN
jgi:hypothetical protein